MCLCGWFFSFTLSLLLEKLVCFMQSVVLVGTVLSHSVSNQSDAGSVFSQPEPGFSSELCIHLDVFESIFLNHDGSACLSGLACAAARHGFHFDVLIPSISTGGRVCVVEIGNG